MQQCPRRCSQSRRRDPPRSVVAEFDDVTIGEVSKKLPESPEPVVGLAEGRLLAQQRALEAGRPDRSAPRPLQPRKRLCKKRGDLIDVTDL